MIYNEEVKDEAESLQDRSEQSESDSLYLGKRKKRSSPSKT